MLRLNVVICVTSGCTQPFRTDQCERQARCDYEQARVVPTL